MQSLKFLLAVGAMAFALPAFAQDVSVEGAYMKPLAGMDNAAALYLVIKNPTKTLVTLVDGASDAAAAVELYATVSNSKGVPQLLRQPEGINIMAASGQNLVPGGVLYALTGLKAPLKAGDKVRVTVKFAQGIELPVEAAMK